MVFTLEDSLMMIAGKLVILVLALMIAGRLVVESLANAADRVRDIKASYGSRRWIALPPGIMILALNVLFVWILIQGTIILLCGYAGIPAKQLLENGLMLFAGLITTGGIAFYLRPKEV